MIWLITGTILYGGAVWLLLRFKHRAHRKPTPRIPDILSPYAKNARVRFEARGGKVASAITMERWRRQFDACCGKVATKPLPLTGIEKAALEPPDPLDAIAEELKAAFPSN